MTDQLKCMKCGQENDRTCNFCIHCGVNMNTDESNKGANKTSSAEQIQGTNDQNLRLQCPGCNELNSTDAKFCFTCGCQLDETHQVDASIHGRRAGFWIRAVAFIIDLTISDLVTLFSLILIFILQTGDLYQGAGQAFELFMNDNFDESSVVIANIFSVIVFFVYFTFFSSWMQRTPGKAILGLRVIREDGQTMSYWRSFGRTCAYFLSAIPLLLGFLAVAISPKKRAWHDFISESKVVRSL